MAINEFGQSTDLLTDLSADTNQQLDVSSTDTTTNTGLDSLVTEQKDLTTNLFVNSLNGTTTQTTIAPKGTSANSPLLRQQEPAQFENLDDFFNQSQKNLRQNPLYQTGAMGKLTPTKTVEKYDDQDYGYIYGIDNDDFYLN